MFNISNEGIIQVPRGDSFELEVPLNIGTVFIKELYTTKKSDSVYLGIMEPNQMFEDAIVRKKVTDEVSDTVVFKFSPKDTQCLLPGKYYYQVKLQTFENEKEYVKTIVDKTLFYITE